VRVGPLDLYAEVPGSNLGGFAGLGLTYILFFFTRYFWRYAKEALLPTVIIF
jgi:hypothetical protein